MDECLHVQKEQDLEMGVTVSIQMPASATSFKLLQSCFMG